MVLLKRWLSCPKDMPGHGRSREMGAAMHDDISDIAAFYTDSVDYEHDRLERHQLEYELTWRYLAQYLPAQGHILELGAATGRYTLELARRGYQVTAVDLTPALLERCQQRIAEAGFSAQVQCIVADARDLQDVPDMQVDAVLIMGPLYHLIAEADRRLALQEALARLCAGGLIISAFISRFGAIGDLLATMPEWINDQDEVQSLLHDGKRPDSAPRGGFRGYFVNPSELAPLHEALGCETLVVAGVEPGIGANDACYRRLKGQQRQRWLDLLYAISSEPSILGASRHLLYIGKKWSE